MDGDRLRVSVLASGSGTNFQALVDRFHGRPETLVHLGLLLASRPGISALARAERAGVPTAILETKREAESLRERLAEVGTDLVVLAGYLRLIPAEIVREYWGRMINIHPALLPAFGGEGMYGRRVHEAVLEAGARVTGVTVHFVDESYDRGPIIAQWPVPVKRGDDPQTLAARVLEIEHWLLGAVVDRLAAGEVRLASDGTCEWRTELFPAEGFVLAGRKPTTGDGSGAAEPTDGPGAAEPTEGTSGGNR
ncbi:MAG: phosphoribosylglycinamide formyltransferase [Gemmatimonadota bacterium]